MPDSGAKIILSIISDQPRNPPRQKRKKGGCAMAPRGYGTSPCGWTGHRLPQKPHSGRGRWGSLGRGGRSRGGGNRSSLVKRGKSQRLSGAESLDLCSVGPHELGPRPKKEYFETAGKSLCVGDSRRRGVEKSRPFAKRVRLAPLSPTKFSTTREELNLTRMERRGRALARVEQTPVRAATGPELGFEGK